MNMERSLRKMNDNIKIEITVNERKINVLRIDNKEYISLTDLAMLFRI